MTTYDATLRDVCRVCRGPLSEVVDAGFVNCSACRDRNRLRRRARAATTTHGISAPRVERRPVRGLEVWEPNQALTLEGWRRQQERARDVHFVRAGGDGKS